MSILIKRTNGRNSGVTSKNCPPNDVYNVKLESNSTTVNIKWCDPDNSVIGGDTFATWSSTILVRKEGSAPKSPTDGTVVITNIAKNKYKDTAISNTGLTAGKTYYYRFFVYGTNKLCNQSESMIYSIKIYDSNSTTLSSLTWSDINEISERGEASKYFKIGDSINIKTNSKYGSNVTVTASIWDFNHFDKSDKSGKAGIVFGIDVNTNFYDRIWGEDDIAGYGEWVDSELRVKNMPQIFAGLPGDLQSVIKNVDVYTSDSCYTYYNGYGSYDGYLTSEKVFIPGVVEIGFSDYKEAIPTQNALEYFTDSFKRYSYGNVYWLRDIHQNHQWCTVNGTDKSLDFKDCYENAYIRFCFCV